MRKRIISLEAEAPLPELDWLDLADVAEIEITSEDPEHPIEAALIPGREGGWRAEEPGPQVIRIRFNQPEDLEHIHVAFVEERKARTQEFTLRCWKEGQPQPVEIVRQQYNFSPPQTWREVEDFQVALRAVSLLELTILPDISHGPAKATLAQLRIAAHADSTE